jgi:hypothetical protein
MPLNGHVDGSRMKGGGDQLEFRRWLLAEVTVLSEFDEERVGGSCYRRQGPK